MQRSSSGSTILLPTRVQNPSLLSPIASVVHEPTSIRLVPSKAFMTASTPSHSAEPASAPMAPLTSPADERTSGSPEEESYNYKKAEETCLKVDVKVKKLSDEHQPNAESLQNSPPEENTNDKETASTSKNEVNGTENKKKRAYQKRKFEETAPRKSTRINRKNETPVEVVSNYSGQKDYRQARGIAIPTGLQRKPYRFPITLAKEKERLRIDMNGPSTRSNPDFGSVVSRNRYGFKIHEGKEYQADVPVEMNTSLSAEDEPDRDELIWKNDDSIECEEFDEAFDAIRRQFNGRIPLDSFLRRFMACNYNIDDTLETIEQELVVLPQPFELLNIAQQNELERVLRKQNPVRGSNKQFRAIQERFMRSHYLGEIIQYFYTTKRRGCFHKLYTRCNCRETLTNDQPVIDRVECYNCTRCAWPDRNVDKLCLVCELFYKRNQRHRVCTNPFSDVELQKLEKWKTLEAENGREFTFEEVKSCLESERLKELSNRHLTAEELAQLPTKWKTEKADLVQMTCKFVPETSPNCSLVKPYGADSVDYRVKEYKNSVKLAFLKAFESHGREFQLVAEQMKCSELEANIFYKRFNMQYDIDKLMKPQKAQDSTPTSSPKLASTANGAKKRKRDNNSEPGDALKKKKKRVKSRSSLPA